MIFNIKKKNIKKKEVGDAKVVTRFAIFPMRIDNNTVIWLEKYSAKYLLCHKMGSDFKHWEEIYRWIEKDEVKE